MLEKFLVSKLVWPKGILSLAKFYKSLLLFLCAYLSPPLSLSLSFTLSLFFYLVWLNSKFKSFLMLFFIYDCMLAYSEYRYGRSVGIHVNFILIPSCARFYLPTILHVQLEPFNSYLFSYFNSLLFVFASGFVFCLPVILPVHLPRLLSSMLAIFRLKYRILRFVQTLLHSK